MDDLCSHKDADLAHLVERDLAKVEVAGSSPVIRLKRVSEKVLAFFVFPGRFHHRNDKNPTGSRAVYPNRFLTGVLFSGIINPDRGSLYFIFGRDFMELLFAKRLREYRLTKDMTQEAMAKAVGISPQSVSKWERGGSQT